MPASRPAQPPIWDMLRRAHELYWPIMWPAHLPATQARTASASSSSDAPPQERPQVDLLDGEQAGPQLPLGGQPDAV